MVLMALCLYAAVVAVLLCSSVDFIQSPSDVFGPVALLEPTPSAARDFGAVVSEAPIAVMRPRSAADIARLLGALSSAGPGRRPRAAVAARGAGHSLHGQAQARGGIVVETRALPRAVAVSRPADGGGGAYADVGAGALWVEVLEECLRAGLAPRSWTDYLYLTVGGTLSNGGISGQAFKHGPQISNVLELEVVTGTGEVVTCSPTQSPELFFAVLGGLGQFGIITRARIPLQVAPPKVRWVRAFYDSFETFNGDQELLISMPELVDYVEGFMVLNEQSLRSSSVAFPAEVNFSPDFGSDDGGSKKVYYCIEFAVHDLQQQDSAAADHVVELVSGKLSFLRPHAYSVEVAYFDFLNRVRMEEESLRSRGLWDVPHPWLNVFVPRHGAAAFKDLLMGTVTQGFEGPVLVYPLLTDRWDGNTSAVVPAAADGVVYVFSVLRSTDPARCGGACVEGILEEHYRVADEACRRLGAKQYLARQPSRAHWRDHFGSGWDRFVARKARFDPMHVLGPGQGIFPRTDYAAGSSM
ncbi:Cytokinin dehydrogenase 8 [Dichanthelium oligosanthes]|uniref:cytokinin dehydrogenase n=1 Tax=Dichanthelium oligosanthes TaxID=888268 RepID=A0A1E5WEU9_9POAL|nr:Cytokinin dehydrogenase 8 [Dichanthelium oligosanthes]